MTPAELASIRERVRCGWVYAGDILSARGDVCALLDEVERISGNYQDALESWNAEINLRHAAEARAEKAELLAVQLADTLTAFDEGLLEMHDWREQIAEMRKGPKP